MCSRVPVFLCSCVHVFLCSCVHRADPRVSADPGEDPKPVKKNQELEGKGQRFSVDITKQ